MLFCAKFKYVDGLFVVSVGHYKSWAKERVFVVGLGDVGRPLFELLRESGKFEVYGFDVDKAKMREVGQDGLPNEVDIMHACIPCGDQNKFVDAVAGLRRESYA